MSMARLPPEAARRGGLLTTAAIVIAIAGGLLSIATALLVTASVFGRWIGIGPVPGDFELVQIAVALSVFSFLPLTQARRGNIIVDTFTARLPRRVNAVIDALWDFVYAGMMALLAWCLSLGAREAYASGVNSVVLGAPLAPVFTLCAMLIVVLALVAVQTGQARLGRRS